VQDPPRPQSWLHSRGPAHATPHPGRPPPRRPPAPAAQAGRAPGASPGERRAKPPPRPRRVTKPYTRPQEGPGAASARGAWGGRGARLPRGAAGGSFGAATGESATQVLRGRSLLLALLHLHAVGARNDAHVDLFGVAGWRWGGRGDQKDTRGSAGHGRAAALRAGDLGGKRHPRGTRTPRLMPSKRAPTTHHVQEQAVLHDAVEVQDRLGRGVGVLDRVLGGVAGGGGREGRPGSGRGTRAAGAGAIGASRRRRKEGLSAGCFEPGEWVVGNRRE
jgi:hypothetical protein